MSAKISIFKSTADGEQLNVEFTPEKKDYERIETRHEQVKLPDGTIQDRIKPGIPLRQYLDPYFRLVDDRLREMNIRIMVTQKAVRSLSPEAQIAFHNIMDILHGQQPTEPGFREILRESIQEVTEKLLSQGLSSEQVEQAVRNSYGELPGVVTPKSPVQVVKESD